MIRAFRRILGSAVPCPHQRIYFAGPDDERCRACGARQ